ncbi:hypothetical protein BT63DRAFT_409287 [Microthyrium microscopicum]|uniref:Uncharacterized protein n=1 Tax=Microthyrium microscopicum TaxID=703497 RepID=A0A6A6UUT1_9PEZI|nr:hypothetical protein BT63DRAFT_409287 [Microthyrium microscopicum]
MTMNSDSRMPTFHNNSSSKHSLPSPSASFTSCSFGSRSPRSSNDMAILNKRRAQILALCGIERLPPLTVMSELSGLISEVQQPLANISVRDRANSFGQHFPEDSVSHDDSEAGDDEGEDSDGNPLRQFMTIPARKCPDCAAQNQTVWVIPGKCCPRCGVLID